MRFTLLHNRHHKVSQSVSFFMHCKTVTILLRIRVRGHFVMSITKNHESHYVAVLDNPPRQGSMVCFHYQFKPEPCWPKQQLFFVLVGLDLCFESCHFVWIVTRKTIKRETGFHPHGLRGVYEFSWQQWLNYYLWKTNISNLRFHKFINEGTM